MGDEPHIIGNKLFRPVGRKCPKPFSGHAWQRVVPPEITMPPGNQRIEASNALFYRLDL